jgi:FG-GAP-like repeat
MSFKSPSRYIIYPAFFVLCFIIIESCSKTDNTEGEKLAKTYCSGCHLLPSPNILPKNVWQYSTLPYMGILMGIENEIKNIKEPLAAYTVFKAESPMISQEAWEKIKKYYLDAAPKKLEFLPEKELLISKGLFETEIIYPSNKTATIANFTLAAIDTVNQLLFAGDQSNRLIRIIDKNGVVKQTLENQNAFSSIDFTFAKKYRYLFTSIGKTTQANQEIKGAAFNGYLSKNELKFGDTLIKNLDRPINTIMANLDNDSELELITCEFGFKEGGLSIWKKNKLGIYNKQNLTQTSGALKVFVKDIDNDSKPDIVALFAQGDERIVLYKNKGNLQFEESVLLRFPPIYGSNYFDMVDLDKDGKLDIVYAAGDNDDFSTILKPYHGIYIFKNKGDNTFKQIDFFHQNGACKLIAKDFDLDGDIDLASISLFPDVDHRPKEGFMLFMNNGKTFEQKTLDINHLGRWSVMDAGDIDGDGDIDLVLGSHPVAKFPSGFDQAWKASSGLILLRNKTK